MFGDLTVLIRGARTSARLSQAELASKAGIAQHTLSGYETGKNAPSVPVFERLLVACNVRTLAELQRLIDSLSGVPGDMVAEPPVEPPWADLFAATSRDELMKSLAVRLLRLEEWIKEDLERRRKAAESAPEKKS